MTRPDSRATGETVFRLRVTNMLGERAAPSWTFVPLRWCPNCLCAIADDEATCWRCTGKLGHDTLNGYRCTCGRIHISIKGAETCDHGMAG